MKKDLKDKKIFTLTRSGSIKYSKIISTVNRKRKDRGYDFSYLNIGYYLLIPILIATFLGVYLDRILKTKPLLTLLFIVLGAAGIFYNLIKLTRDE